MKTLLAVALTLSLASAIAGENGGVATGERFQAWRVDLDTPFGPISVQLDPYSQENPYFGWPMTNRLLDKIVHDCGIAAKGDCAYDGHYPVTVGYSATQRAQYPDLPDPMRDIPTPDQIGTQSSYLWSDALELDAESRSYPWSD